MKVTISMLVLVLMVIPIFASGFFAPEPDTLRIFDDRIRNVIAVDDDGAFFAASFGLELFHQHYPERIPNAQEARLYRFKIRNSITNWEVLNFTTIVMNQTELNHSSPINSYTLSDLASMVNEFGTIEAHQRYEGASGFWASPILYRKGSSTHNRVILLNKSGTLLSIKSDFSEGNATCEWSVNLRTHERDQILDSYKMEYMATPTLVGDKLYVAGLRKLFIIDAIDGSIESQYHISLNGDDRFMTPVVFDTNSEEQRFYLLSKNGKLFECDPDNTVSEIASESDFTDCYTAPLVDSSGHIFFTGSSTLAHNARFRYVSQKMRSINPQEQVVVTSMIPDYGYKGTIMADRYKGIYFMGDNYIDYFVREYDFTDFTGNLQFDPLSISYQHQSPLETGYRYVNNHPALLERADFKRSVIATINNTVPQPLYYPSSIEAADISTSRISISYVSHNYMNELSIWDELIQNTTTTRMSWAGVTPYLTDIDALNMLYPDEEGYLTSYPNYMPVVGGVGPEAEPGKELESIYPPLGHSKLMMGKDNVMNLVTIPTVTIEMDSSEDDIVAVYVNGYGKQPDLVIIGNEDDPFVYQAVYNDLIKHPMYTVTVIRQDSLGIYHTTTFNNIEICNETISLGIYEDLIVSNTLILADTRPKRYNNIVINPDAHLIIGNDTTVYVSETFTIGDGAQVTLSTNSQLIVNRVTCDSPVNTVYFHIIGEQNGKYIVTNNMDVTRTSKLSFSGANLSEPNYDLATLIIKEDAVVTFSSENTYFQNLRPSSRIGYLQTNGSLIVNDCVVIDCRFLDSDSSIIEISNALSWGHLIWRVTSSTVGDGYSTVDSPMYIGYPDSTPSDRAQLTIDGRNISFKTNTYNVYGTLNVNGSGSCFVNDSSSLIFKPGSVLNLNGGDGLGNGAQLVANGNNQQFGTIILSPNVHISGYKKNPNPNLEDSYGDRIYISDHGYLFGTVQANPRKLVGLNVTSSHPQNHRWDGFIIESIGTDEHNFELHDSQIKGIEHIRVKNPENPWYEGNSFENCNYGIYHLIEDNSSPQITIVDNTFLSNSFGIYLEDHGSVDIPGTYKVTIEQCDFGSDQDSSKGNNTAIAIRRGSEAIVKHSSFYSNGFGIMAMKSVLKVGGYFDADNDGLPTSTGACLFVDSYKSAILFEHTTLGDYKSLIYGNTFTSTSPSTGDLGIGIWVSNSEVDIISNSFIGLAGHGILMKGYSWGANQGYHGFSANTFEDNNGCELIGDAASISVSATQGPHVPLNLFADQMFQETGIFPKDPLSDMAAWDKYILANISTGPSVCADVRGNYFHMLPSAMRDRFYSSHRDFIFDPGAVSPLSELIDQGISEFYQGLFDLSIDTMKLAVETYPDSSQTALALDFLYLATRATDADYAALKSYLDYQVSDEEMVLYQKSEEIKTACAIQERDYYTAISRLEQVLNNPKSVADSLFALIDQAYCFMALAQSGAKALPNIRVYTPDFQSYISFMHDLSSAFVSSPNSVNVPMVLSMEANYPNPFNPSTTIRFNVPSEGMVKLSIYNIKGQRVKELVNEKVLAGNHSVVWNGTDVNNRKVGSGIYFARVEHSGKSRVRKMMLLK